MIAWRDCEIAVIDTETTGFDPMVDRVVEVAAVVVRVSEATGITLVRRGAWLLDPGRPIGEASAIHGISDDDVFGCPCFGDVAGELAALIGDALPAAYHAPYDLGMVSAEWLRTGLEAPPFLRLASSVWLDPLTWERALEGRSKGKGWFKLSVVAARHGFAAEELHRAEADAMIAARVLGKQACARRYNRDDTLVPRLPVDLAELREWQALEAARAEVGFLEWKAKQPRRTK